MALRTLFRSTPNGSSISTGRGANPLSDGENRLLALGPSLIHGMGVFARRYVDAGKTVFETEHYESYCQPILGTVQRTPTDHVLETSVLRWVNHSCLPNVRVAFHGKVLTLLTIRCISVCEELTCDYRVTEDSIPSPFLCSCPFCTSVQITGRAEEDVK
jgi:SET domain-containing protein